MNLVDYCAELDISQTPWELLANLENDLRQRLPQLSDDFVITDDVAIHTTATIRPSAIITGPAIVGPGCFIGPHALLRGGVHLRDNVTIGPSCEVKHAVIGSRSALAHFNFVGDSVIGSDVNFEAGAHTANHYNERQDKTIYALVDGSSVETGTTKFGGHRDRL